ncbi:hypothetical protein ACIRYZ_31015 [Kitasatospora sp. NPDC101155]|uniref:hypothetical protein n=1 Tax=Kitasatospora sp. NPDC101155 TaxID=3364097 RepID=UPI00382A315E
MSLSTTRRATTVRTLAGTVLTAALLVSTATACGSTPDAPGTAAPSTAPTATSAPAGTPDAQDTTAPTATPTARHTTTPAATPAATPSAHRTTTPAAPGKPASATRSQPLPDGSTAEIQDLGNLHYVAKIMNRGQVLATLETNGTDAGLDANDMFVVLSMDGTVHSWMGGGHQGPGTFKLPGGWTAKVTKTGELDYRAQILGNENEVDGTLEANQHDIGAVANGVYIVLTAGGEISAHE